MAGKRLCPIVGNARIMYYRARIDFDLTASNIVQYILKSFTNCPVPWMPDVVPCLMSQRFVCNTTGNTPHRCLDPRYLCDGHNDCWNSHGGTDEALCGKLQLITGIMTAGTATEAQTRLCVVSYS